MGLILNSTAAVAAERQGRNARQLLEDVARQTGDDEIAISVIKRFLDELLTGVPIEPVTVRIAIRAGRIDGGNQARGIRIPLSDLLIGVSALDLGYRIGTANVRHFQSIDGLDIVQL